MPMYINEELVNKIKKEEEKDNVIMDLQNKLNETQSKVDLSNQAILELSILIGSGK